MRVLRVEFRSFLVSTCTHTHVYASTVLSWVEEGGERREREREIWASLSDDSMPRVDPRIIVIIIIIIIIIIANEQALIGGDR